MNTTENAPYAPPGAELGGENVRYVGFWWRTLASIIDTILIVLITMPLVWGIYGAEYFESDKLVHGLPDFLITYVLPFALVIFLWNKFGATPGKMIIGAKIVDQNSFEAPSIGQLVGRYFGYILAMLPLFLGFFWVGWDKRKQGFHDKVSKTVVIKK